MPNPLSLRVRKPLGDGLTPLVRPGEGGIRELTLYHLQLQPGQRHRHRAQGLETGIVVLSGHCNFSAGRVQWESMGRRAQVFDGPACAAYVPSGQDFEIEGVTPLRVIIASAPSTAAGDVVLVRPEQVQVHDRGKGSMRRAVHDIIMQNVPAQKLLLGETFNSPGQWSSYPPHKHDQEGPDEVQAEEVYFFVTNPPQGFGLQWIYTAEGDIDQAYAVRSGDVTLLPRGYHPVAAAPGYQLYYLWAMSGTKRVMLPKDDPAHSWVKQAERV
ncbi:MAG: 5-deoxy-glucuronate isomerase [Deinococcus sp.]|nr:5-deoxy-glucuronate isomerase [Deinococcus sp.]